MKVKDNFILRQVADTWCVLPLADQTVNLNGMITLNDSGAMLWKALETETTYDELIKLLLDEYVVTKEQAASDVEEFLQKLLQAGCIEE